jgi:hypothetical protein
MMKDVRVPHPFTFFVKGWDVKMICHSAARSAEESASVFVDLLSRAKSRDLRLYYIRAKRESD